MRGSEQPSFEPGRKLRVSIHVAATLVAVAVCYVCVNVLAARHSRRFDWSGSDRFALSEWTEHLLKTLTNTVRVSVLYDSSESDSRVYGMVESLLGEYAHRSEKIELRKVDALKNAAGANQLRAQYRMAADAGEVVVFESEGRYRSVYFNELSVFEGVGDFIRTREVRRSGFRGEALFSGAIAGLMDPTRAKVYFLEGHGESKPDSDHEVLGYSRFARILAEKNMDYGTLNLANSTNEVPRECQLLIVAGALTPPLTEELEKVGRYLDQGGRMLLMTHPLGLARHERTGWEGLMQKWGIYIGLQMAGDRVNTVRYGDVLTKNLAPHATVNPISRGDGYLYFRQPRVIARLPDSVRSPEAPKGENVVMTSTNGFTLTDYRDRVWYTAPGVDRQGEIPLAAAVEKGSLDGIQASQGLSRVVVIGDSSVFGNQDLGEGWNRDFAILTLAWLLDRPQYLAIGPKPLQEYRLTLNVRQVRLLKGLVIVAMPGAVLLTGWVVWYRRRI